MHALARELLAFIVGQKMFEGPALLSTSHESASVYWSIVGQRVGAKFRVSASDSPSVFDALEHTRCFI
ncbi:MAG: hypothetical protein JNM17_10435 [Archangium sp.]|nr:hypothetical protein [Archangium sp.]